MARSRERVYQPLPDHIFSNPQYRNCRSRLLCRANSSISGGINDIDLGFDQLRHKFWNQTSARSISEPFDREVLTHYEALPLKFIEHRDKKWRIVRKRGHAAETIGSPRLLRHRDERPCSTRAHKRDELAPPHRFPRAETLLCLGRLAFFCRAKVAAAKNHWLEANNALCACGAEVSGEGKRRAR